MENGHIVSTKKKMMNSQKKVVTDIVIGLQSITFRLIAVVFFITVTGFLAPGYSASINDRKDCLQGSGNQAVAACRRALDTAPEDLELLLKLGDLLQELGNIQEAVDVFQKAATRFPENKTANHKLEMARDLKKEQEWLEKRKAKKPSKTADANKKTQIRLNRIRCTSLKGSNGLAACDEALAMLPGDPVLHHSRGDILLQMGRIPEAKAAFAQALKFDPDNRNYSQKLVALGGSVSKTPTAGRQTRTETVDGSKPSPAPSKSKPSPAPSKTKLSSAPPKTKPPSAPPKTKSSPVVERMALLKSLLDQGLIDKEEFDRRKSKLLDTAFQSVQTKVGKPRLKTMASINLGAYHALVIGIQNYRHLTKLQSVRKDVVVVADVLQKLYGFKVQSLFDATRRQILLALGKYRRKLGNNDNLLIYYAGHGWLDEDADVGYWLPVDAHSDNDVDWLSLDAVTSSIRAIPAKHVMIVADSCYSGKLTRGIHIKRKTANYWERMAKKRTRVVLASGGLEPVLDSGGAGGHSVFASAFLKALKKNSDIMDGTTLFTQVRRPVMLNASQTPEYADIRKAGHEGGDFLFIRK
jgi:tetratricopeptide (TPR) repeat protein